MIIMLRMISSTGLVLSEGQLQKEVVSHSAPSEYALPLAQDWPMNVLKKADTLRSGCMLEGHSTHSH